MTETHSHKRIIKKKVIPLLVMLLVGWLIWIIPHSEEVSDQAWSLFAIFIATILGIVLKPMPISALAIIAMSFATLTKTLTLEQALGGFSGNIVWLVLFAFFISRGFIKTGLGERISYWFVGVFGKKTLGLSYGLLLSEVILAPAIPSVTARAGGVIFPIVLSLSKSYDSDPEKGTQRKIGSFLTKVAYQGSVISSAMFLTAMAANPLIAGLTQEAGYTFGWGTWALAGIVPGIISLLLMPFVVYKLYPPLIKDTPDAARMAKQKLQAMGRFKKEEWMLLGVFVLLLVLWIFGPMLQVKATVAAMVGLALLLVFGVLHWHEVLEEKHAWDTFIWFATLIMLATYLGKFGLTSWFSEQIVGAVGGFTWVTGFSILVLVYFYSHYFFATATAHVGAMYPAFLLVAIGLGTPPGLAIPTLAFASNLMGGLTHYGSGPAPIYYGSGYVDIKAWWTIGFILSVINLAIWIGLGAPWWKLIGLW